MKAKTIKAILREKIDEWIETIKDKELQKEVRDNCIVTGGAIASMLLREDVNDYDIYFTNKQTAKKVAEYYVEMFLKNPPSAFKKGDKIIPIFVEDCDDRIKIVVKSQGVASEEGTDQYQYFEGTDPGDPASDIFVENVFKITKLEYVKENRGKYRPIFLSSNAITLSDDIQLIVRFYGSPDEIHENYDFVHTKNYYTEKDGLVLNQKSLEAIIMKELKYVGSLYPICSLFRLRKFLKRGWTINAGEILKISYDISKLDMHNIDVLTEQLVGIDQAYMHEVIDILKKDLGQGKTLDRTYLVSIIDKVFSDINQDEEELEELLKDE
jgi:hypothetical protein